MTSADAFFLFATYATTLASLASLLMPPDSRLRISVIRQRRLGSQMIQCSVAYSLHTIVSLIFISSAARLGEVPINYIMPFLLDVILIAGFGLGPDSFAASLLPFIRQPISTTSSIDF